MSVFCLGSEQIKPLWHVFGHHLVRFENETGLLRAADIKTDLCEGLKQVWGFQEGELVLGIAVTEVKETGKGKVCWIVAACGTETTKGQIDAILEAIEAWARETGCSRIMLQGRRGWLRRLKVYRQIGIILEKEF